MKKLTFLKSLLMALCLLGGGTSAWAENMTTMTGLLGLADNSNGFGAYASKVVTIAAGETYQYSFVNYNKGAEGANIWENWAVEGRRSDNSHCFDFRADGGFWTWKPDADAAVLNASYSGNNSAEVSATATEWLAAYNGVTVTLTVSRSNDGDVITVAHSATTNTSATYAGTFTCSGFGTGEATIILTNELSHQVINKVVYQHSTGGTIYTARTTHISGSDADLDTSYGDEFNPSTGYNKISGGKVELANKGWGVNNVVYVQVDATDVPTSGATMTSANLSLKAYGTGRDHNIGIGYNSSAWSSGLTWNTADRSITTLGGTQTATKNANTSLSFDILSIISAGNTKTLLIYDTAAGGAPLWDISATISYSTETLYTATFTETNSLAPTVTIYSDSERTAEVTNGTLLTGNTYYYTATLTGYNDYQGSFTVDGANPDVSFTMVAKALLGYTVNAVDASSNVLCKIAEGTVYEGDNVTISYPQYVLSGTTLYNIANNGGGADWFRRQITPDVDGYVYDLVYNNGTVSDVVFYAEAEDISGMTSFFNNANRASNGYIAYSNGAYKDVTTLEPGKYQVYTRSIRSNNNTHELNVKCGESVVGTFAVENGTNVWKNTEEFTVYATSTLAVASEGGSQAGLDFLYVVKTGDATVDVTFGTTKYATFASPYALDLTSTASLKAYKAAVTGATVNFTELDQTVPANTGVLLEGTAGETVSIPVVASGAAVSENAFLVNTAGTTFTADAGYTYYGLKKDSNPLSFWKFDPNTVAIPANKAYLKVANGGGVHALNVMFDDSTDGIQSLDKAQQTDGNYYDLSGRRVMNPTKGIYVKAGKKVVVK